MSTEPLKWVDLYSDQLYAYALRVVRDHDLALDLVQETFMAALAGKDSFQSRSSEKTWIFGILKHKILDYLRKKDRQIPLDEHGEDRYAWEKHFNEKGKWKIPPGLWDARAEDLLERKEFFDTLEKCISSLGKNLARVFMLRELQEEESETVCQTLEISQNNLWTRMYRARSAIRKCLEEHWFNAK